MFPAQCCMIGLEENPLGQRPRQPANCWPLLRCVGKDLHAFSAMEINWAGKSLHVRKPHCSTGLSTWDCLHSLSLVLLSGPMLRIYVVANLQRAGLPISWGRTAIVSSTSVHLPLTQNMPNHSIIPLWKITLKSSEKSLLNTTSPLRTYTIWTKKDASLVVARSKAVASISLGGNHASSIILGMQISSLPRLWSVCWQMEQCSNRI